MITIKIEKQFMEWIIALINTIIRDLRNAGVLSEDTKYLRTKFKNRKRKSHTIKIVKDVETSYIIITIDSTMIKDMLLLLRKTINHLIPVLNGVKAFFNIFNNKDNELNKAYKVLEDMWQDRYLYYIFTLPNDKDKFFKNTQFIARSIDRDEWEVVFVKYGEPKDNKKRNLIENDMKRTTNTAVQQWINDHMVPVGESFETLDLAKYRLMNGDEDNDITIPQDEFKEEKK